MPAVFHLSLPPPPLQEANHLLIQCHAIVPKHLIHLAFSPEHLLHAVVASMRADLADKAHVLAVAWA